MFFVPGEETAAGLNQVPPTQGKSGTVTPKPGPMFLTDLPFRRGLIFAMVLCVCLFMTTAIYCWCLHQKRKKIESGLNAAFESDPEEIELAALPSQAAQPLPGTSIRISSSDDEDSLTLFDQSKIVSQSRSDERVIYEGPSAISIRSNQRGSFNNNVVQNCPHQKSSDFDLASENSDYDTSESSSSSPPTPVPLTATTSGSAMSAEKKKKLLSSDKIHAAPTQTPSDMSIVTLFSVLTDSEESTIIGADDFMKKKQAGKVD